MSTGPYRAPWLKSWRENDLQPVASVIGIDERRPASISCMSSGEAWVALLEFWNFTVMCTMSFCTRTFEIQIV